MSVNREELADALSLLASVNPRKIEVTEQMIDLCHEDIETLDKKDFDRAIKHFYNARIFPVARDILEVALEADFGEDWNKIVSIARQSSKQDTISGLSFAALLKVTNTQGMRSALTALGRADDFTLNRYRSEWQQAVKKQDLTGLPPADEIISLDDRETKTADYPVDTDFSVRTASVIRLLKGREIKTSTAKSICASFPAVRKAEIMALIEEMEGVA